MSFLRFLDFNGNFKEGFKKYLGLTLEERFELYKKARIRLAEEKIKQTKKIEELQKKIDALEARLSEDERRRSAPIPFIKELDQLRQSEENNELAITSYLAGLSEADSYNRESVYFKEGDLQATELVPGEACLFKINFTTYYSRRRPKGWSFDAKSSNKLAKLVEANMYTDEKGFVHLKSKKMFSAVEIVVNEKNLLYTDRDDFGNHIFFNQNFQINIGTENDRLTDKMAEGYNLPVRHFIINKDFTFLYQPRYKNKFATPEIIQKFGVDEWIFSILINVEGVNKELPDFFPSVLSPMLWFTTINIVFHGVNGDTFEVVDIFCHPTLICEKFYEFQDEMEKKYAENGRPKNFFGYRLVHSILS